ncbi:MAG: hypothetical protein IJY42_00040 [Clostridia bacterium]|nr:hypothetical protein [Clostridia bacterium]
MKPVRILLIVLLILGAVLCCCASVLSTVVPKFVERVPVIFEEEKADGTIEEHPNLDYTVNGVFVVKNQEEFFSAINHGYPYIQLSPEIENPLIINQHAENLDADMILDLNGIEIQRNGHEPILNIGNGVRLTVTDTSAEKTGALYNPVGSVFNITGGVLTIMNGTFESGPRYSEYYTYNNNALSDAENTQRTLVENTGEAVLFYQNVGEGMFDTYERTAPIITSYPTNNGASVYIHGNLYFDKTVTKGDHTIKADTYCYYRTSEDETNVNVAEMADWYYTYWVDKTDNYKYVGATAPGADEKYVQITIYGYENVIKSASEKTDVSQYYAAIQMSKGKLDVTQGGFYSYFGVNTTACVNASGGELAVKKGTFSSRVPNAWEFSQNGVMIKEIDAEAFQTAYFNNYPWASSNTALDSDAAGKLAAQGESYCILNSGNATVTINTGSFYSSNNNIIKMNDGKLTIGGGDLTKRNTLTFTSNNEYDAAIYMADGTLSVTDTSYHVFGDYSRAVFMENGLLTIEDSRFTVTGDHTYGIYSTVEGMDSFHVKDTSFILDDGTYQTGIYASRGRVNVLASTNGGATISTSGSYGKGIFTDGGSVASTNYNYELLGDESYGIHSAGGTVDMMGGTVTLESNVRCYGVYAASGDASASFAVNLTNAAVNVGIESTNTKTSGTHHASIGVYLASANHGNTITLNNTAIQCYELGIGLVGGQLNMQNGGSIKTMRASAIAISGGNLTVADATNDYTITSANTRSDDTTNAYTLQWPDANGIAVEYVNTDGIYVDGGSFTCYGNVVLTHTGLQNVTNISNYNYTNLTVTSYAVRVSGGDVRILKGNIIATAGGGICCSGGNMIMGAKDGANQITVSATGNLVGDTYNALGKDNISTGWQSKKSITGGHAIELNGGDITVYGGTYEAQFGNGVAANSSGTINIYDGTFYGWMNTSTGKLTGKSGPSAFYGLKVIGGATVRIYDGTFNGGNGGGFVTGIDQYISRSDIRSTTGKEATVYVYAGIFGGTATVDAFNVYDYSNVVFGAHPANTDINGDGVVDRSDYSDGIIMNGTGATIAANKLTQSNTFRAVNIYVYYGQYVRGGEHGGVWNDGGFAQINAYNTNNSIGYTSIGGSYTDMNNGSVVYYVE